MTQQLHKCPDGTIYTWESRKDRPKECPRCKQRLDKHSKEVK
jgi:hypothetical protein